ncbi:hypothetical protein AAU61_03535 [Desulfocarbo indianensis]|nr:hypothetical protein AAU61_03535 [Desulfocarbo indianensis]
MKRNLLRPSLMCLFLCLGLLMLTPALAWAHGDHGHAAKPAKKAILLVTFGTSLPEAQKSFDLMDAAYRKAFPGYEIRWAYTAKFIRDKLAKQGKSLQSPEEALAGLMAQGYGRVAVQSLHVIPGSEWQGLVKVAEGFAGMGGCLRPVLGPPLMASAHDVAATAEALLGRLPAGRKAGQAVVFMGHGSEHAGGMAYQALAYELSRRDPLVFLGTVEGLPSLEEVMAGLKARKVKKVFLAPFMTVVGDHVVNDMVGPEPDSWLSQLKKAGYECEPVLEPITQNPGVSRLWLEHTKNAMQPPQDPHHK